MAVETRDISMMVEDILSRIVVADVGITDVGQSSVIRAIVEAIVAELDMQYYQLDYLYDSMMIDTATGEDLDRLIAILGVARNQATKCTGIVRFGRSTGAPQDIPIVAGTKVSTRNVDGVVIEFVTTEYGQIDSGQTYADIAIEAVVAGNITVAIGNICVMNAPVMGVDSVTNQLALVGGTDAETDVTLRERAKMALDGLGKSTSNALESAIEAVDGVLQAIVLDQNRGVGTVDISVVTATTPAPQEVVDQVLQIVSDNKAAGIDVDIVYPSLKYIAVNVTVVYDTGKYTLAQVKTAVNSAILEYAATLSIAETFVVTQMIRYILNATSVDIDDITVTAPAANVTATALEIIRVNSVTVNGEVV